MEPIYMKRLLWNIEKLFEIQYRNADFGDADIDSDCAAFIGAFY